SGAAGPEGSEIVLVNDGNRADALLDAVITKPAERRNLRPTRHRARIMMPAFGLVPGVAPLAIAAPANVADQLDPLRRHPAVQHQDRGRIFEAGHHFLEIREWIFGTLAARIRAYHKRRFIV